MIFNEKIILFTLSALTMADYILAQAKEFVNLKGVIIARDNDGVFKCDEIFACPSNTFKCEVKISNKKDRYQVVKTDICYDENNRVVLKQGCKSEYSGENNIYAVYSVDQRTSKRIKSDIGGEYYNTNLQYDKKKYKNEYNFRNGLVYTCEVK